MSEPMTLAQIIFKLSVFLSPEEAGELARQMAEHFPPDLAANMSAGLDMALIAMKHEEPGRPRLFMGGAAHDAREDEGGLRACVQEHNLQQTMALRMEILQAAYPLRAAALYMRVLLVVLADLFERNALDTLNDEMMTLFVSGLRHAEAVIEARCVNCPKSAAAR